LKTAPRRGALPENHLQDLALRTFGPIALSILLQLEVDNPVEERTQSAGTGKTSTIET